MKRRLFLISLIFIIHDYSFCQNLPDSSAIWTIASIGMGNYYENNTYAIEGDTIINSLTYKSIFKTNDSIYNSLNSNYFCAIRELNDKWYFVPKDQTIEYLLYDFNVNPGDTIIINNPWTNGEIELIVFNIDSIELNGKFYKNIEIRSSQQGYLEHWIKGIGCTNGLFFSGFTAVDIGFQLLCFHENDTLVYLNSPNNTCGYLWTGIKTNFLTTKITISPNPAIDKLYIDSKIDVHSEIYNISGKKLITTNRKNIDISNLESGIYFLKVFDNRIKLVKIIKIIKQ